MFSLRTCREAEETIVWLMDGLWLLRIEVDKAAFLESLLIITGEASCIGE